MIVMVALSYRFLGRRHPKALRREDTNTDQADPFSSPWAVLKDLVREPSRARLLLMAGIFCFAGMWAALRSLTTPYGTEVLGMTRGAAGGIALPGAIAFLICVVPLAYLSHRLGELLVIRYGIALFVADQPAERLQHLYDQGRIRPLANAPVIERKLFERSHTVAMMGVEPIQELLRDGYDVILAGRASDTALFAALPHLNGADPGLTWHMAKTIECGAACAIPPDANGLLATLRDDHFDVTTLADGSRLTPRSVAAHTLYENADPFHIAEPSGTLDTTHATYEAVDERTVRVRGSRCIEADGYTNKLEGAELVGYQTVIVGGVRDKVVIERLPELLPMAKKYFDAKVLDVFGGRVDPDTIDINYRLYGTGTVLAGTEPTPLQPQELGVLITVTAPDQGTAHAISTFVAHASSHLPIPEYDGLVSTLAYPYSPPEMDRGPLYRFALSHVATGVTPTELFRTTTEEL
ncbi:acyclic terpene utilization AtuA family protein [Streptomyces mirabilis]|uniref:acyclic terpene utilization AtuA family protein n=1 Tax=Streptomyces mirabilis TaxID=68239 RepID=UPI0036B8A905